ncbi:nuclear transport factor 2 family protein [Flavilitoribacter nigricans]|uniref:Nuclear transport factor 2 family protein n=1 Tax=Flavilitoribacter nigricans (strain ATCC 23147 / DSM 23189 / NBRC 102662 / NCIMB 1420 / SS-2) TaxID=1122177 RepID=A0A2D0N4R5_FLAN2|nr:nuclear transport factor 2 family protein [Flavilitoribacter nigricans]PHN03376.1 hypothetical protein CRP01_27210 [Flavilitoribacter nigricans DSM 23189 = NBRC 102662]
MNFKTILITLALFIVANFTLSAQSETEEAVLAPIHKLFDGMRAGDSSMVRAAFHPTARLQTTFTDKEGKPQIQTADLEKFITNIGTPHEQVYDEQIWGYEVMIEDNLATVWTPYTFYLGERMSHCGVNAFQVAKTEDGWKILQITDTRKKENCQEKE